MAGNNDQMDQDAIAAQWEASMANEDPAEAEKAAAANEISGTMALQWAAMVEDGSRDFGGKNSGERVQYLKIRVVLEVKEDKTIEAIKPSMPRVSDIFQTYMRELRAGDLNGSAGLFRLKEELTRRVNVAVAPQQISAVLFKEIVIQ